MKNKATLSIFLLWLLPAISMPLDRRTPIVTAVEKALPSVVNIGTDNLVKVVHTDPRKRSRGRLYDKLLSDFMAPSFPRRSYKLTHRLGSGVIVDPRGYILTNHHVVERAATITVTLANESTYRARVVASDEVNDLALIRIEPRESIQAIDFAEDDDLLLAETVIVLGNPFGLSHTVTVGVLSGKNREVAYEDEILFSDILQTDAAVNPGSSGGPLINTEGDMIGINVSIPFRADAQNIGFAVPIKRVRTLLSRWFDPRITKNLRLGFEMEEEENSLTIVAVDEEGPVAAEDLRIGDRVISLNGQVMEHLFDFNRALLDVRIGEPLDIEIEGEEGHHWISYLATDLPRPSGAQLARERLGITFGEDPVLAASSMEIYKGLPIKEIEPESIAVRRGLKPGLRVTRINRYEIQTLDDVGLALERVKSGDYVFLKIMNIERGESFLIAQTAHLRLQAN